MGDKEVSILLKTKDQSSAEFKKVDKAAREMSQQMKAHGIKGGEGLKVMTAEMKKLEAEAKSLGVNGTKNLEKLRGEIKKLEDAGKSASKGGGFWAGMSSGIDKAGMALAAVAAVGYGAYAILDKTVLAVARMADEMGDLSVKTGISADFLQRLRYQAEMSDVDFGTVTKGIQKFNKITGDAAGGNKAAMKAFKDLGINIRDSNKHLKDGETLYKEAIDKISKLKTIQEQTAAAQKLFGKSGADMIPMLRDGAEGFSRWSAEAEKMGIIMSDKLLDEGGRYDEMMKRLKTSMMGTSVIMAEKMLPVINDVGEALGKFFVDHQDEAEAFAEWWASGAWGEALYDTVEENLNTVGTYWTNWWENTIKAPVIGFSDWFSSGSWGIAIYEYFEKMKSDSIYIVTEMWNSVTNWFTDGAGRVKNVVKNLVNDAVAEFRRLKNILVDNSIVPDMVIDIEGWFARMETTLPASAASMVDATNAEFEKLETPAELARPDKPGKPRKKSAADIEYDKKVAAYEARKKEIDATKKFNDEMEDLYKEGLTDYQRAVYEEKQLFEERKKMIQAEYDAMSEAQKEKAKLMDREAKEKEAHERRMKKIEEAEKRRRTEVIRDTYKAQKESAKAQKESAAAQREAYKTSTESAMNILGVGLKEQAAVMVPWEVAEAATDFAEFLTTKDATLLASSLAHVEAAKSWADAAKESGGGGGSSSGGGGGGGPKKKKDGGGRDVPGRNSEAYRPDGWGDITIDTGRLSGKMIMGDAGDITNWVLGELNQKYRQHARIEWVH